jgi:hypothetical protein
LMSIGKWPEQYFIRCLVLFIMCTVHINY